MTRSGAYAFTLAMTIIVSLCLTADWQQTPAQAKDNILPIDTLRLKNFKPRQALITKVTRVDRPRYPAIDNHCHLGRIKDPRQCIEAMDEAGVVQVVNLDGMWGERLKENLEKWESKYPGRFLTYARVNWKGIDEPGWGEGQAEELERSVKAGAHGLKIAKTLGLYLKDKSGQLVKVDDPRIDPVWAACGRLGIPIEIHIADPAAFFQPIDNYNERIEELGSHPNWSFYGPQFPSHDDILAARDRIVARHPNTVFIGAHMGNYPENLAYLAETLDKYPNFYIDIDARLGEIGRQPYSARRFFIKYQDRVMFGTDKDATDVAEYRVHWRFLETDDEYMEYAAAETPPQGRWMVYGLYLPDEVLKKMYYANAVKLIPGASVKN